MSTHAPLGDLNRRPGGRTPGACALGRTTLMPTTPDDKSASPYSYHTEPEHVGGARYVKCERCGAECVPADPDRMLHRHGCPEGGRR